MRGLKNKSNQSPCLPEVPARHDQQLEQVMNVEAILAFECACNRLCSAGKPTVPSPPVPDVPENIRVLASKDKQSCTERCEEDSLDCSESHFPALNDCNRMRESFACEAGCEAGAGLALPAYIISKAAKSERPAMCLTWSADLSQEAMKCDLSDTNRQRACPCAPK